MPTTTKMGIVYPASTDLVKDGATAMGTISTTVDAKTGLVLLNTTSFSAVSSQSFNNVFSTNFDNYRVIYKGVLTTGTQNFNLRLRASSSDNTNATYFYFGVQGGGSGVTSFSGLSQTSILLGAAGDISFDTFSLDFFSPKLSENTIITGLYTNSYNGLVRNMYGAFASSTSFDGFSIFPASSTITGSVSIYGYNK